MDAVEEIKSRLAIDELVGRYVDLKRSGASYKGLCPFHQEKTPSFYVTPQRGTYHCFGCGKGGDVFSFLMEMDHVAFPDALKQLAEQTGVALPERERRDHSLKTQLYDANDAALRYFRRALEGRAGDQARAYLDERNFGDEAISLFDLGFAPRSGDGLTAALRERGIQDRILLAAGLASADESGSTLRDRFRGRLMFPIRDVSGKIVGFGGRILGEGQPKYLNSPQTEIFDKSSVLFGIHRTGTAMKDAGSAVLVEGYLDAVRAHLGGFTNVVASLGTAVTSKQLSLLGRMTQTVILALDPDPAGQGAAIRASLTALHEATRSRARNAETLDLRIARLPDGHGDPDELIRDHPDLWESALQEAVPAFEFFFRQTMDSLDHSTPAWRQEAIDQILPAIQQLSPSPGWQAVWIERLAAEAGVDVRAVQRAMPRSAAPRRPPREDVVARTTARALAGDSVIEVERALLALLLQILVVPRDASHALADVTLRDERHRSILARLLAWQNYDYDLFREDLPEDARAVADELRGRGAPVEDGKISIGVRLHLAQLRRAHLQEEQSRARAALDGMPLEDQMAAAASIARMEGERRELDQEMERLHVLVMQGRQGTIDQESGNR
ncbi:MAG TPA: DNA primase [Chloroflexota bacterium]|nr:DNA primase [Chloroflexota bacterium]